MSIRPRLGVEVPELTARVARTSNPARTTAMWVRDRLDGLWEDEDFAGWYSPPNGRPGISPTQLATVSVLQFLLDLSDRDAAEAVRCRIDFKYALGLDLDDPGFHHSVLGDFRERLLEEGRADRLLDLALARLKEAGLVRERTTQRTDSTHVLAAVRDLTRLELVTEAVRAALEELARTAGHALACLVDDDWGRRYGRPVRLGKNPTRPKTRMNEAGADARRLLEHLAALCPDLLRGPRVEALRQILVQNYHWDAAGRLRWRDDEGDAGLPPSAAASSHPTTRPRATPAAARSPAGPATSPTSPRPAPKTPPTSSPTSPPCPRPATTGRPWPGSTPGWGAGACSPASTWRTAATPPWSTWNGSAASTRSPSPGRCPAPAPASTATKRATPATTSRSTTTARRSPARRARSARDGTALPTSSPTPPRSSSHASPRNSASPALPGPSAPPPATASALWDSPRGNCSNCRSVTALTSRTLPGASATRCGPASRAPSASSPTATACATAATEASPKPTCSTS